MIHLEIHLIFMIIIVEICLFEIIWNSWYFEYHTPLNPEIIILCEWFIISQTWHWFKWFQINYLFMDHEYLLIIWCKWSEIILRNLVKNSFENLVLKFTLISWLSDLIICLFKIIWNYWFIESHTYIEYEINNLVWLIHWILIVSYSSNDFK